MKTKFKYTDGMTPIEISQYVKRMERSEWFFMNDLEKQDRQTDRRLIECEMLLYKMMGLKPEIVDWWFTVHETWHWAASQCSGNLEWMRLTG